MTPPLDLTNDDSYNEAETRQDYINKALASAGWIKSDKIRVRNEYQITKGRLLGGGKREKPLIADYILQYKNQGLAVIEAKSKEKYYTEGVTQAKEYAKRLNIRYAYATNGKQIYFIDMEKAVEHEVDHYPTPDELWEMTFPVAATPYSASPVECGISDDRLAYTSDARCWIDRFSEIPFNDKGGLWQPRYYQENAVKAVLKAVAEGKQRILLTLATGTGKTAISAQIVWKLFKAKWNRTNNPSRLPRILFLADRNVLANQAFNAYSGLDGLEENALIRIKPESIKKAGRVPKNASIFFTIFQTFMSGTDETPYFGQYPKDFFDLVIIDECHRGGANDESKWRAILDYFSSAVQLGMTATPKIAGENINTYKYFGDPVYIYSLKEGINDGFLTPFRVQEITTNIDTYQFNPEDEILSGEIDPDKIYDMDDQNRIIQIKQAETFRVKKLMELLNQKQKTLVFCASQNHAAAVRDLINQYADEKNPEFCCRVTANDGIIGDTHLKQFQNNERNIPRILTTSEKLSTGVDAPEIRNIVLLRPVNQMIEFKQIIGRGTRLYDGKDYFTIYDFVKAHEKFNDAEWDGGPIEPETPPSSRPPRKSAGHKPKNPMIVVRLSDGRERTLDSNVNTLFYDASGKPISAEEFVTRLFGDMPTFFKNEADLRAIWSDPETRKQLLERLERAGYAADQLENLTKLIHGENSDLFDVLSYVAYQKPLVTRTERAECAKKRFITYDEKQQEFLNFVLEQYVSEGVQELNSEKLQSLLKLKYNDINDAKIILGPVGDIRNLFVGFQQHLYSEV